MTFVIDEGPRFKVRNIVFDGNRVFNADELKQGLKLHSGEFYSDAMIEADTQGDPRAATTAEATSSARSGTRAT